MRASVVRVSMARASAVALGRTSSLSRVSAVQVGLFFSSGFSSYYNFRSSENKGKVSRLPGHREMGGRLTGGPCWAFACGALGKAPA